MFDNVKTITIVGVSALIVGAVGTAILLPTKIETKVETKVEIKKVEKKVIVDREITKVTKPDGTVTEVTKEKDRSTEESKDTVNESKTSTVVTNPKELTVKVQGKTSITDPTLPTTGDLGVGIDYNLGHGVEVGGSVFKDGTVTFGIGFSF